MDAPLKWTEKDIKLEAKKHTTKTESERRANSAYAAVIALGNEDKACQHMARRHIWSEELIIAEAKNCRTRAEFKQHNQSAYGAARKLGIIETVCAHMDSVKRDPCDACTLKKKAAKYKIRSEFKDHSATAHKAAIRLDLLDKICKHMPKKRGWTEENSIAETKKYKVPKAFSQHAVVAYTRAELLNRDHKLEPRAYR